MGNMWIIIIIVAREFSVSGFRIIAASKGIVVSASKLGKFKTQSQIIAVIFALLNVPYYIFFMVFSLILTIISGIDYIWNGRNLFSE